MLPNVAFTNVYNKGENNNKAMTSLELLQEIDAWLSFNNSPSKEQISELRNDIKKHLTEQLHIHDVSNCKHANEQMHQGDGFVYVTCADCGSDL